MSPKSISAAPDPCPLLATRLPGSLTLMASSLSPASLFRPVPPPVSLSHRARPPPLPSSAPLPPKALSILLLYAVCSLFRVPAQASSSLSSLPASNLPTLAHPDTDLGAFRFRTLAGLRDIPGPAHPRPHPPEPRPPRHHLLQPQHFRL